MILVLRIAFVSERRIKYFLDLSVCTIIPTLRKEVKKNASKVRISGLWAMKGKKQTGGKSYSFPPVPKFTPIKSYENTAFFYFYICGSSRLRILSRRAILKPVTATERQNDGKQRNPYMGED